MGFLGFDKRNTNNSQNLTDNRVSATEGALVPYGQDAIAAGGSVFAARDQSTLNLTDASTSSTIYNDPAVAKNALTQQRKLADSFLEAYQIKDENLASVLASMIDSNAALAETAATNGEGQRNKALLIVTLAVIALVGWIFWRR